MAATKLRTSAADAPLRGAKLIKKALDVGKGEIPDPEPVAPAVLKKMTLPNGEPVSPAMKELLKHDSLWLSIEFDEDEGEIESLSLEDLIEEELGEESVGLFAEAYEILQGDCIPIGGASEWRRFLYVGEADAIGEYPVITIGLEPKPFVSGFVPFDVWVAQELGAVDAPKTPGAIAPIYASLAQELAASNGDGRTELEPKAGAVEPRRDDDDDEDEGTSN